MCVLGLLYVFQSMGVATTWKGLFMKYSWHGRSSFSSFPQISALREAGLAREMHAAGLPDLKWLYMGELEAYVHFILSLT